MSDRRTVNLGWVLVAVLSIAAVLPAAVRANASDAYVTKPCFGAGDAGKWGSMALFATGGWELRDDCPRHLELAANDEAGGTSVRTFPMLAPGPNLTIATVRATLSGSNGAETGKEIGIRVCRVRPEDPIGECGPLVSVSGTDVPETPGEPKTLSALGGEIPPGGNQLQLVARCAAPSPATCPVGSSLRIVDLEIQFRDEIPPSVEIDLSAPRFNETGWNNFSSRYTLRGHDSESGISFFQSFIGIGDKGVPYFYGGYADSNLCRYLPTDTVSIGECPIEFDRDTALDNEAVARYFLEQGTNSISLYAVDATGNQSEWIRRSFKFDSIAPQIADLRAVGVANGGWIGTRSFDVAWVNAGEADENAIQSGVVKARYYLKTPANKPGSRFTVEGPNVNRVKNVTVGTDGNWTFLVETFDRAGNVSGEAATVVKIDSTVLKAPELETLPLVNKELLASPVLKWLPPANAVSAKSGICGYALAVNDTEQTDPGTQVDVASDAVATALPHGTPDGSHWLHFRAVSCSGVAGEIVHAPVDIDATPPSLASSVADSGVLGDDGILTLEATDSGSGVHLISYSLDGVASSEVHTDSISLRISDGSHSVAYSAVDHAGNRSDTRTLIVSVDTSPPTGWFEAQDPARPTLVKGQVHDVSSGISSARIEFRSRSGESGWIPLSQTVRPPASDNRRVSLVTRFQDLTHNRGEYDLRILVTDVAGHSVAIIVRADGSPAYVKTPLRARPTLIAGFEPFAKRCAKRTGRKCSVRKSAEPPDRVVTRRYIAFGSTTSLGGRVTDAAGAPAADLTLGVYETLLGVQRKIGETHTAGDGKFNLAVPAGPSRKLTVKFAGSETVAPAESEATVLTRAKSTLVIDRRRVGANRPLSITGRVFSGEADIPTLGKSIQLQFRSRRGWSPLTGIVRTASDGSFRLRITLPARSELRYRLRVLIPPLENDWPFAEGFSNVVAVTVRP